MSNITRRSCLKAIGALPLVPLAADVTKARAVDSKLSCSITTEVYYPPRCTIFDIGIFEILDDRKCIVNIKLIICNGTYKWEWECITSLNKYYYVLGNQIKLTHLASYLYTIIHKDRDAWMPKLEELQASLYRYSTPTNILNNGLKFKLAIVQGLLFQDYIC